MKISVVMPVYNCKNYLDEAIQSVLTQTFDDFEFIIIDDGSTDDTVERVLKYTDPRIRLLRNTHDFIGTLNMGLSKAQGKYIARMDSDDIMMPERLATQYQTMETHPDIAVCASWFRLCGQSNEEIRSFTGYVPTPLVFMLQRNIVAHPTTMLRKDFLDKHALHYEEYPYAEDYKLWCRIAQCEGRFWVEPAFLLNYRMSPEQVGSRKRQEQDETTFLIKNEILDYLITHTTQEKALIDELAELAYKLNEKELLSEHVCFDLFFDLFAHIYESYDS